MKVLFHLGHPAHFHLFKHVILKLQEQNHETYILIKKKDILEDLVKESGFEYINILPEGRKDSKLGLIIGMIKRDIRLFSFCRVNRPDVMIGTSIEIGHVGRILGIPSINVNEDDAKVIPFYAKLSYPFNTIILSPEVCDNGKWNRKTKKYPGYHELAYLHPEHFEPSNEIALKYVDTSSKVFLLRFSSLNAHHDSGVVGISNELALKVISLLKPHGKIYLTSERPLSQELEPYRMAIDPSEIHHVMAYTHLYVGDSQTMAAEAGVLGIPFIRYNDFVGRIGYLEELENKYELGYGIKPPATDELLQRITELLKVENLKTVFSEKRRVMLKEKVNTADFIYEQITNQIV